MRLVIRPTRKAKKGQGSLFGPREGEGQKHGVKQHTRRTKAGVTLVREHQRAGQGHATRQEEVEPAQPGLLEQRPASSGEPPKPKRRRRKKSTAEEQDTGRSRTRHRDAGHKIGGARKDAFAAVHARNLAAIEAGGDSQRLVTRARVLGKHDAEYDRGLGSSVGASMLKRELFRSVAARPADDPVARQQFVAGIEWMRKSLDELHTVDEVTAWLENWRQLTQGNRPDANLTAAEAYERFGKQSPRWSSTVLRWKVEAGKITQAEADVLAKEKRWAIDFNKLKEAGLATSVHYIESDEGRRIQLYRHDGGAKSVYGGYAAAMGKKITDVVRGRIRSGGRPAFYKKAVPAARVADESGDWTALTGKAERAKPRAKSDRWTRRLREAKRVGGPRFRVTPDADRIRRKFGMRGVEYGNWLNDDDAQQHLTQAYGALLDLADVLELDPKMLAHGKSLGLAFGARGKGQFGAHYEPNQVTINLTHTRGAGALAHEWAHFMDHILTESVKVERGKVKPEADAWVQETPSRLRARFMSHGDVAPVHQGVSDAVAGVMAAIHGQDFDSERRELNRRKKALSKRWRDLQSLHGSRPTSAEGRRAAQGWADARRKLNADTRDYNTRFRAAGRESKPSEFASHARQLGAYWSRPHEMFARAFEAYVQDKLEDAGRMNTYLVDGTRQRYGLVMQRKGKASDPLEPYPQGDERKSINAAFDALVQAMKANPPLRKAMMKAMGAKESRPFGALHAEAALVDARGRDLGRELEALHARATRQVEQATRPADRAAARQAAYHAEEMAGALRYSAVTGRDESDFPS